jgi:hypothetical protein
MIPAAFGGATQHSYLYDCTALMLITTLLGPRRYWRSFYAFMEFHDALGIPRSHVPSLEALNEKLALWAKISYCSSFGAGRRDHPSSVVVRRQIEELYASASHRQIDERYASGLPLVDTSMLLDRSHEEGVPSTGALLAEEEYASLRDYVKVVISLDTDFDVWPYVPDSETGWVVTSELLWMVAAAKFIHHVLSGPIAVTEAAFQEAVHLHVQAVESYAKLLGLPPSSLTSLCNNACCDEAGTFDAAALLIAIVQLGQDSLKTYIVSVELCPVDSEEFPLTGFRVCATSIAGEAKYISIRDTETHFEELKEKIRLEFGLGPNRAIEGLTSDGTLLRNSDKLPGCIMNTTHAAGGDDLV